jgi:hypothetical protein
MRLEPPPANVASDRVSQLMHDTSPSLLALEPLKHVTPAVTQMLADPMPPRPDSFVAPAVKRRLRDAQPSRHFIIEITSSRRSTTRCPCTEGFVRSCFTVAIKPPPGSSCRSTQDREQGLRASQQGERQLSGFIESSKLRRTRSTAPRPRST